MPDLLNDSASMMCPHGGTVSIITGNTKTKGGGGFLALSTDTFTIAGCAFNVAGAPHPCMQVNWVVTAMQSKVSGTATLNEQSVGLCVAADQAVQGTVLIQSTQQKVAGN